MVVTLIGSKLAKEGLEFVYLGITKKCRSCKLKTVCSNLEPGRRYRIVKVRDKKHKCGLHGEVIAVEVEKLPITVNIRREQAEATAVAFSPITCDFKWCREYENCNPDIPEREYRIVEVVGDVHCPKGYELKKVMIEDM